MFGNDSVEALYAFINLLVSICGSWPGGGPTAPSALPSCCRLAYGSSFSNFRFYGLGGDGAIAGEEFLWTVGNESLD